MSICIAGLGAAGLLLLHMFQEANIPARDIICIDPYFDGGDLQRSWRFVVSNTPWSKLQKSMQALHPTWKDQTDYDPAKTTELYKIIRVIRDSIQSYLHKTRLIHGTLKSAKYKEGSWKIECGDASIETKLLFLCTGSEPRRMKLPIPEIPLSIALHKDSLKTLIYPTNHVIVVGTKHSGCLVLENLRASGCRVSALYNTKEAFSYARDGDYDGIKEDAATIADQIKEGKHPLLELVQMNEFEKTSHAIRSADWIIYCIGFERKDTIDLYTENEKVDLSKYDSETGKIGPSAWGFGIGFPNRSKYDGVPGKIFYDVSVLAFTEHILNQKDEILKVYGDNCNRTTFS